MEKLYYEVRLKRMPFFVRIFKSIGEAIDVMTESYPNFTFIIMCRRFCDSYPIFVFNYSVKKGVFKYKSIDYGKKKETKRKENKPV